MVVWFISGDGLGAGDGMLGRVVYRRRLIRMACDE